MSTSAEPQRLLLVDYDGKILYDFEWRDGRYVSNGRLQGNAVVAEEAPPASLATAVARPPALSMSPEGASQSTGKDALLVEIQEKFEEIENAVLTNSDGKVLAALHPEKAGELATVAILTWPFLQHTAEILDCGEMREILLRDGARILVMYPLAEHVMLSVIIPAEANLGMLHWVCREALEKHAVTLLR